MREWILSLHLMAVISWMAGVLYIWRLFVYHAMETETVVMERFQVMERRLLRAITMPAAIVALVTGLTMIAQQPDYLLRQPWLHAKLTLVALLIWNTLMAGRYRKQLLKDPHVKPHQFFRVMNEVPTLLMIGIVIFVIVRPWPR